MNTGSPPHSLQRPDEGADEAASYARNLIELSLNPLVTIDPQGRIADANRATEEVTGIARDRLIGTDFADRFSEPEKARAAHQRVLEEGFVSDYPLALRHVSGALTDVEYNATVYRDASGELRAVFVAGRDPTEAQLARLQVARLAAIAASSQNARYSRDLNGTITSWNAAAEMLFGYAAQEAIGLNGAILIPPGREGETQELIKRMLRGDRGFGFETQRLCKDGSLLDVALTISPISDVAGDIVALAIIAHDISRRVRAERELRESEEKFAAAFRASPDLMDMTTLSDGKLLEVNEGFTQLLGYTRAEALGKTTLELLIWADPADRAAFVAGLEESGQTSGLDVTLRRKDGALIACVASARTMELHGETRVLTVIHDITARKRAEREIRELNVELELRVEERTRELAAANRELESFSYSVSHDLRAPLRVLDGFSQALLEDCGDTLDKTGKDYLRRIRAGAQHMGELIDALLDLSRINRRELTLEDVDVSALVRKIAGELLAAEPERSVEFVVADGLVARADGALLEVALGNLLSNAWKFTSKRATARIEVGCLRTDAETSYFVRDDGVGFDPAYGGKLFTPFQRLHAIDEFAGTGIGLATVQRVVSRHGGRCWAEGHVGKGATFYFTLPGTTVQGAGAIA